MAQPCWCIAALALSILWLPLAARAQKPAKIPVLGVLDPAPPPGAGCLAAFKRGLSYPGYREGQNLILEYRYGEFKPDRFPTLATELVQLKPDVIWTNSPPTALALKPATTTIPIVVGAAPDFVALGLVDSRSRPGGNLTGLETRIPEFLGKQLELLKAAVSQISRVAVLVDVTVPGHERIPSDVEKAARVLGLHLLRVEAGDPGAFDAAFAAMAEYRADALVIMDSYQLGVHAQRLVALALAHRLPTIAAARFFAEAGSLISYGVNPRDLCQRSAIYVDKILKGIRPAELPVEGPMKFEFIINLKTAHALGLTIPPTFLFQADEVIQ